MRGLHEDFTRTDRWHSKQPHVQAGPMFRVTWGELHMRCTRPLRILGPPIVPSTLTFRNTFFRAAAVIVRSGARECVALLSNGCLMRRIMELWLQEPPIRIRHSRHQRLRLD